MITSFYAGVLAIVLAVLILNVVRMRMKHRVGLGDGGIVALQQAIRVHGNYVEIVPMVLIIMMLFEILDVSPFLIHVFGCLLILSRLLHLWGLLRTANTSFGRFAGTVIALGLLLVGGFLLIFFYMAGNLV